MSAHWPPNGGRPSDWGARPGQRKRLRDSQGTITAAFVTTAGAIAVAVIGLLAAGDRGDETNSHDAGKIVVSDTPTTMAPESAPSSSAPPGPPVTPTGYISVFAGGHREFIDVPNPSQLDTLTMSDCMNDRSDGFACYLLHAAPSDIHDPPNYFYDNQQWQLTYAQKNSSQYVTTIETNFSGAWLHADGNPVTGHLYLSYLGAPSAEDNVGLVPIGAKLDASRFIANYRDQFWVLTPEKEGSWELSPWQAQGQCLTNSAAENLALEACDSDSTDQLWTIADTED
jgi:hypothetical protein